MKESKAPAVPVPVPASRYVVYSVLAISGCLADLLTKSWVFAWRGMPRSNNVYWVWEPYCGIETSLNPGALFGLGAGYSTHFAVLSIFALLGIIYWLFIQRAASDALFNVTLGIISGGILGNLYDRLGLWCDPSGVYHNEVRDWILFKYQDHVWPNFNIADSLLVCGAGLLMFHAFFAEIKEAKKKES